MDLKKYIEEGMPEVTGEPFEGDSKYMDKFFNQHKLPIPDLDLDVVDPEISKLINQEKMR